MDINSTKVKNIHLKWDVTNVEEQLKNTKMTFSLRNV